MKHFGFSLILAVVSAYAQVPSVAFPHHKGQAYVSCLKKEKSQTIEQSFCLHTSEKYLETPLKNQYVITSDTLSRAKHVDENNLHSHYTLTPALQLLNITGEFNLSEAQSCTLSAPVTSRLDWEETDGILINELTLFRCPKLQGKPMFLFQKTLYNSSKAIKKSYNGLWLLWK